MQRTLPEGIVIACDFCGTDWDQVKPMIEGHRGSVICLDCLKRAGDRMVDSSERFACVLCLREFVGPEACYRPAPPAKQGNPLAAICRDCLEQATEAFAREGIS